MAEVPSLARGSFISRIVETFLKGPLSPMLIAISLLAGAVALLVTPREEEPQIEVPLADVLVQVPGATAEEVERQVATRLEKLLYQIDGVEYVYSMSRPNQAVVTVRFFVGEDREASLVKLYNKISMSLDQVPPIVTGWVVKPIEIDDVPVVNVTFYSDRYNDAELRRIAEEIENRLQAVENTARTQIVGGRVRQIRVEPDPQQLASRGVGLVQLAQALRGANVKLPSGTMQERNEEKVLEAGTVFSSIQEVRRLVVAVHEEAPVYLEDVATVTDTRAEPTTYTRIGFGPAAGSEVPERLREALADHAAVTLAVAKRRGSNAVKVARDLQAELDRLRPTYLPDGVELLITRDYGKTANDKVNELVEALGVAILIVIGLIAMTLGWREGLIVATAVPITFALTLLINYMTGYTINRVTLFALILALGLVVDDPIVDVENIYRHFRMRTEPALAAVMTAVNEVRPPIILATLAVIVSFLPMFFITGMMGPYMRPMALNVPLAMLMSMVVAFTITPWMSYHVLKREYDKAHQPSPPVQETLIYRAYRAATEPFLTSRRLSFGLILGVAALFAASVSLVFLRRVPLKMLPYDNKNELQVVLDMPEGTTLEQTEAATHALANRLRTVPEVTNFTTYVGTASPIDFNGLVRHYYLREGPHIADIRVNLVEKDHRVAQSHEIVLRVRQQLRPIAERFGANVKLVEMPPGPPVISTITVEVYGQPYQSYAELQRGAGQVEDRLKRERGVVDVDNTIEAEQTRLTFVTDKEKASLAGIDTELIARTVQFAVAGADASTFHQDREVNPLPIHLQLPVSLRSRPFDLEQLYVPGPGGQMVALAELGTFQTSVVGQTIYHKNLRRVVYVFAEVAGRAPAEVILDTREDLRPSPPLPDEDLGPLGRMQAALKQWLGRKLSGWKSVPLRQPGLTAVLSGEGEWKITLDVFRDLGIAFGAACLGIYILLVYETKSYAMPLILMISIPLTIIGILPGFWILNLIWDRPIGQYHNPVFFTATAMIGMIALSGIAVRNAILLIDFIHAAQARGTPLRQAIVESGAVRLRPIFLTAGTAMLAAWPITLDPIFSGLAWALIFGLLVSTLFTLLIIPVVYHLIYGASVD